MNQFVISVASVGVHDVVGLLAVVATIAGVWLQWKRQAHLAEIEEAVKNGRMASDEAQQRSRFVDWRAQALVILGLALLFAVALGWIG